MRVFIAVEFSDKVKEDLFQIQNTLRSQSIKGNFTRKENFHLTLRFIGEVETHELDKLKAVIDETALKQHSKKLIFNRLGHFPRGNKSIIWLGGPLGEVMSELIETLETSLEGQGYPRERKAFVPHITLGREVVLRDDFRKIEQKINTDPIEITVGKISLMHSTRVKGQLAYIPLYVKEFNTENIEH